MATPLGILLIKLGSSPVQTTCIGQHNLYLPHDIACYNIGWLDSLFQGVCWGRTWKEILITISRSYDLSQLGPPISNPCSTRAIISKANGEEPLKGKVQPTTLSALTQYYDQPLKCFTFQGFQLAPTLEEYERLVGIPCDKSLPYLYGGHYPSRASVARLLKVPESEVLKLKKNRNGVEGIPYAALEERLQRLQEEEDWRAFMDVYGLLVYGIMLFPQIDRYVDLAAIDAFLGKRDWGEHPVVAVLANTYHTLDYSNRKNGRGLRCCTSLLFLWLTAHLFYSSKRTKCPIEDHYWSCIKPLTKAEWTARLERLQRGQSVGTHSGMRGRT
ncbi:hypothetical protein CR513_05665, partial [Mucuna pruriens]